MGRTHIKWRLRKAGEDRVNLTVFAGTEGQTLQNAGTLRLYAGEYQWLGAAVLRGSQGIDDYLLFEVEGEKQALGES